MKKTNKTRKYNKNYTGVMVDWEGGNKSWYKNGKAHREDGPSFITKDGYKQWWLDGKYIWDSEKKT